jgi:acyl-coenzyme A thioesterase PaaI-like protein
MLHGGVISAIADGAMTNCLFARGLRAVTAELNVRFRHPIVLDSPLEAAARVTRESAPLFLVEATLTQNGEVRATATGEFMETPKGQNA